MAGRIEKDSLGEKEVPTDAYYGIQTARAVENYPISGWRAHPRLIDAYMHQKKASALANRDGGAVSAAIAGAIAQACDEVLAGRLRDQFVVDVFQAGAGVSQHMNTNEVLANRAIEILGGRKGDYSVVHPNDHVNFGQSTNDTYPTAMRVASLLSERDLDPVLAALEGALDAKGKQFDHVLKSGRTHLQDAVPVRLGQEFAAYARSIERCRRALRDACRQAEELGIGGTAAGTGLNTAPGYREKTIGFMREFTRLDLRPSPDMREAMQSNLPMAAIASAQKMLALEVIRITNDLRLMASGPITGMAEIILPAVQPGSSIMPGKVNPAILEMAGMVGFQVAGNALAVDYAVQAGQLELNVMMPAMTFNVLMSFEILKNALAVLRTRCIEGLQADEAHCKRYAELSPSLATALNPYIGYAKGAEVVKEALRTGRTIPEVVRDKKLLSDEELSRILDPFKMTEPGITGKE
ncbi:MAG TPA: aspartate ammonia-lyase [Candidatus Polarisedimenticolia bacterium]|nr:aspartate ammonia-lyase [Candidatus Polarisedimenticolia bacterium]